MQYAAIHPYLLQRALYGVEGALLFLLHSSVDWMCCVLMLVLGVMQWSTWNEPQPFLFLVMVERFGAVAEGRVDHFVWCAVEVSRLVNTVGFQLNSVKMRYDFDQVIELILEFPSLF
ncbi:Uncharacterized protein APZ42_014135 [Daphnia magna]|uniref:Uncharacterized protein n=1 Tax=Daphnia magna TaxID=35525 RepID=A0A162Q089_9CRUS|nr:Uncharacterized protein APZ42_014135 [Daphnia magna]